jgi:hypothetical protein
MSCRAALVAGLLLPALSAAQSELPVGRGDKLLLTGGVSQLEGAAGGGLTPWALIAGYGTRDQIGAQAFVTAVGVDDYRLHVVGAAIGVHDRLELSIARQTFDTRAVGAALGLGAGFEIDQDVFGAKLRLAGDAVLEQDRWLPQIALGLQHKRNHRGDLLAAIGATADSDTDVYLSATKLYLSHSLLANATLRYTRANQFGLLGFGGDRRRSRSLQFEGSLAALLRRELAVGIEWRDKPDNLGIAGEDAAWDAFLAWAPSKRWSLTLAFVDLGNIVIADDQRGWYASLQFAY